MVIVNKIAFFLLLSLFGGSLYAQKSTDKLKKEQERLEKNIANTKNLLDKTKSTTAATLNELKLIESQVKTREDLLLNFDSQIRGTELKIQHKNKQITELEKKLESLREQYKKLTLYAYKHRSKEGKLMFIVSSNNYYEALKRKKYLEKIAEIQRKQKMVILQHKKLISKEKSSLLAEKTYKETVAEQKRREKEEILLDKTKQQQTLAKLKTEEQKLLVKIERDEVLRAQVKSKIDAAIASEVAKNAKSTPTKKTSTKKTTTKKTTEKAPVTLSEPKAVELNQGFEGNKGRLPWPVEKGAITETYGKHAHPTIPNLYTHNNGIDISAAKGAQVRCVFEGEVTSVFSIPGAGKVVIVKHGNYRTVYSNLEETYVSIGSTVNTKQAVGSLLVSEGEQLSVAHFEIHQVIGSQVNRINPGLWLTR